MTAIGRYAWAPDPKLNVRVLDPYSHWMLTDGRDFDFAADQPREDVDDFSLLAVVKEATYESRIKSDQLLLELLEHAGGESQAELQDLIDRVIEDLESEFGRLHLFRIPLRRRSFPPDWRPPAIQRFGQGFWSRPAGLDPDRTVVVAVIDDAVNVAHHRFRTAEGEPRVDFAWIQDGVAVPESAVPFGREWTRAEIGQAIEESGGDEEALLRDLGLVDFTRPRHNPLAQRISHGTHVLDLAAGAEAAEDASVNRRIITVSLPSLVTFETSGALLSVFFLLGLQYVLQRTREIAGQIGNPVPLVVNFSYGITGGPHNGQHFVERAIEQLLAEHNDDNERPLPARIVLPAGNGNLDRGHASKTAESNDETVELELPWRVQPGDKTSSYLEIWLPGDARITALDIALPGALPPAESGRPRDTAINLAAGGPKVLLRGDPSNDEDRATVIARLTHEVWSADGEGRATEVKQRIVVAAAPTEPGRLGRDPAPSGIWTVSLSAALPIGGRIEAWIQRDDSPIGSRVQGRQSYFDDPAYVRYNDREDIEPRDPPEGVSVVRRSGTLNGIATGFAPVVVGGYVDADANPAPYTGTAGSEMRHPTVAAVSERSRVRPGVLAAGSRSGSRVAINGTSVAVPQLTRRIAKALQEGDNSRPLNEEQIRRILDGGDLPVPHDRIGYGRLPFRPLTGDIPSR